jgi:hypothetical protein
MKIKPKEEDFIAAMRCRHIDAAAAWANFRNEAMRYAAERMLAENQEATKAALAESAGLLPLTAEKIARYLAVQDRITGLFAEHEELLDVAFPKPRKKEATT